MEVTSSDASDAPLGALEWRLIGPFRGGRVIAVSGDVSSPLTFYFGSTGGGVWKTVDAGQTWRNVSDGYFGTASVGAIAVSEKDPNVIYAGMGEPTIRSNVTYGDGVYKSTDAGMSWWHMGLLDTRQIARVVIHPDDPDTVFVAALGHAFGPNPERGVYRSTDGGETWQHVLFRSDRAGAVDISIDRRNPRIIYAAFWQIVRQPHDFSSGGSDSSLYKSTDGGETWEEITDAPGLPDGIKGKIGVATSPARSGRVWAIIEAGEGGLFRSDDHGASWERICDDRKLQQRPFYYSRLFADPQDEDTVWAPNFILWKSTDGGRTFDGVDTPHVDNHVLWIDPNNPERMIEGNDGGACITFNGGRSWSSIYNQPTAEIYHVAVDNHVPYRVYGAQQDNTAIAVASMSLDGAITPVDWFVPGGGESGYIVPDPADPDVIYGGTQRLGVVTRYDRRLNQIRDVTVWPESGLGWAASDLTYRFNRTFPIYVSTHSSGTIYVGGNHLFRSTDEGQSWERISPDLTRNDRSKQGPAGGPITTENTGVEYYGTVTVIAESGHEPNVIWTGSDDGKIHLSRNGGASWEDVTPPDLPEWAFISSVDVSAFDPATVYVAATRYRLDDYAPYLFMSNDYGQGWQEIVAGIPETSFTRVLREDPNRKGLLYAGTETGLYISFDDGAGTRERVWHQFQNNLPIVPIHDLAIKDTDLVAATHGRSFWILDDLTPLHQLTAEVFQSDAHLFEPRDTTRFRISYGGTGGSGGTYQRVGTLNATYDEVTTASGAVKQRFLDAGENPPDGVIISYFLQELPDTQIELRILDKEGQLIRSFKSAGGNPDEGSSGPALPAAQGLNRFVWDMRYPGARGIPGHAVWSRQQKGPVAPPGTYQVELDTGKQTLKQQFRIVLDTRIAASDADLHEQFRLLVDIRDALSRTHDAVVCIQDLYGQIDAWKSRASGTQRADAVTQVADDLKCKLQEIERELIQVDATTGFDRMRYPVKLNYQLAVLTDHVADGDAAPTNASREVFDKLATQADELIGELDDVIATNVADLNRRIEEVHIPAIIPQTLL